MIQAEEKGFVPNGKPPQPIEWLTENGSCISVADTRGFAKQLGLKPVITQVTRPQRKGMTKSFVKALKRDCAKLPERPDLQTVIAQLPKWFDYCNSYHPPSRLGYMPPNLLREKRAVS